MDKDKLIANWEFELTCLQRRIDNDFINHDYSDLLVANIRKSQLNTCLEELKLLK